MSSTRQNNLPRRADCLEPGTLSHLSSVMNGYQVASDEQKSLFNPYVLSAQYQNTVLVTALQKLNSVSKTISMRKQNPHQGCREPTCSPPCQRRGRGLEDMPPTPCWTVGKRGLLGLPLNGAQVPMGPARRHVGDAGNVIGKTMGQGKMGAGLKSG